MHGITNGASHQTPHQPTIPTPHTQDQLRAMRALCDAAFGAQAPPIDVYDGDTPQAHRASIRQRVQLLITNPDMLHVSILPVHQQFARFLAKLKYVVVDEGHAYRCERMRGWGWGGVGCACLCACACDVRMCI